MLIQIEHASSSRWMRVRSVLASFLCMLGLPGLVLVLGDLLPVDMMNVPRG